MRAAILAVLVLVSGCKRAAEQTMPAAVASAAATAVPEHAPSPARPRVVKEETRLFSFAYSYPAEAAAIPGLKALLDGELAKARAEVVGSAREGQEAAKGGGFPFHPYERETKWQVVADLPGWLSLSATLYDYSGGAHPNHGYAALLWDKAAGKRRAVAELFASKAALSGAIREKFCDALDRERAQRRGTPVDRKSGDEFDWCIDPAESTVILGSSDHRTFDRIGVLVGPYEAGPYAEGDYEITLPVDAAVLAAVRPEYRAAFSASR
jgi:hypothetical protein